MGLAIEVVQGEMILCGVYIQLKSQFVQVETALALARVLMGLISAGYNHGSGSQVAPNEAI